MGKIRTRIIGLEDVEEKQKKEQKLRSEEKALLRSKKSDLQKGKKEKNETPEVKEVKKEEPKKVEKKEKKAAPLKKRKLGKNHETAKKALPTKIVTLKEAIVLLKKIKYAKFDESVELHLNIDETGLKGEVELPHATGKTVRVKVVDDALLEEIGKGKLEFDVLVTHPSFMPKLAKYARVLGPKGLMPNPKAGTISPKPEDVVKKFAKGTLRWKSEPKFPLIHQMIGKSSFEDKNLIENAEVLIRSVGKTHIKEAYVKTTMSPSLKINLESL